jgi:RHS repeat-associated protein
VGIIMPARSFRVLACAAAVAVVVGLAAPRAIAPAAKAASGSLSLAQPSLVRSDGATLAWSRDLAGAGRDFLRYEVHRSATFGFTPSAATLIATIGTAATTSWTDHTAAPGTGFSYRVTGVVLVDAKPVTFPSNEVRVTTPAAGGGVLTVRADEGAGQATGLRHLVQPSEACPDGRDYGAAPTMAVGSDALGPARSLVQFDLRAIPPKASVTAATLRLPYETVQGSPGVVEAVALRRAWQEGPRGDGACDGKGASWAAAKDGVAWSNAGGDLAATAAGSAGDARGAPGVDTLQVTATVADWVRGGNPNLGLLLRQASPQAGTPGMVTYDSDDAAGAARRPSLTVEFSDGSRPLGPAVALTTPTAGATVRGSQSPVSVDATDDGGVDHVDFLLDGSPAGSDRTAPYQASIDTTKLANGPHTLAARAVDNAGNATTARETVTADNTAAPTVAITSPAAGATVSGKASVSVAAGDDVGVAAVEAFVDGVRVAEATPGGTAAVAPAAATPALSWNTADPLRPTPDGGHALSVRVTDTSGQQSWSPPSTVTADNDPGNAFGAGLALGDPALPQVMAESTAADMPRQDPYAGSVDPATGLSGGSLGRKLTDAPTTWVPAAAGACSAGAWCPTVAVTNASGRAWDGGKVRLWYRWYADNGALLLEAPSEQALPASLAPGQSASLGVTVRAPKLPPGAEQGQYHLRLDLYDSDAGAWFSAKGATPLDNLVQVTQDADDRLGLEKFWTFEGEATGAGSNAFSNISNGNMLWRWDPWTSPGRGLATVLSLTYNSLEDHSRSPVGNNFSLAISGLTRFGAPIDIDRKSITLVDGDGTSHTFTASSDGSWRRPPGVHLFLRQVSTDRRNPRFWAFSRPDDVTFSFDADGFPTAIRDRNGNEITNTLEDVPPAEDPLGPRRRIAKVTDAGGRSYAITYYSKDDSHDPNVRGKIKRITDHSGHALDFSYYDDGNLLRITQRGGVGDDGATAPDRSFVFTYTTFAGSEAAIPNAADRVDPDPRTHPQSTRIATIRDPRGHESLFIYNEPSSPQPRWTLKSRTNRGGAVTSFSYDRDARQTTVTAPLGRVTRYTYDGDGKTTEVSSPIGEKTSFAWSDDFHPVRVTENNGKVKSFSYNDAGYLTSQTDQLGNTTTLDYEDRPLDATDTGKHFSLLSTVTLPEGVASAAPGDFQNHFAYDTAGNLAIAADPEGGQTLYQWNGPGSAAPGTLRTVTDPRQSVTQMSDFDANGFPLTVTDAEGGVTRFGYDDDGLLRFVQTPVHEQYNGQPDLRAYRSYTDYDVFREPVRSSAPKSTASQRGLLLWSHSRYDQNGNQTASSNPVFGDDPGGGPGTETTYDNMDRTTAVLGPDHSAGDERVSLAYDQAGRLRSKTTPKGAATTAAGDFSTTFDYNPADRVVRATSSGTDGDAARVTFTCYDDVGNRTASVAPNAGLSQAPPCPVPDTVSHTTRFGYDAAHRQTSVTDPLGHSVSTAYDRNGRVRTVTETVAGGRQTTVTKDYDQRGLVVRETDPYLPGGRDTVTSYVYDADGNLSRQISPRAVDKGTTTDYVTEYTYDKLNRLTRTALPKDATTEAAYEHLAYNPDSHLITKSLPVTDPTLATVGPAARTDMTYFDPGWIATSDDPGNPQVLFDYTAEGWQSTRTPRQTDDNASPPDVTKEMDWEYNADGTLATRKDQGGFPATYRYDLDNNLVEATATGGVTSPDERPATTAMSYDGFGELVRSGTTKLLDDPAQRVEQFTTFAYDADGHLVARGDEGRAGAQTADVKRNAFVYDGADRLVTQYELGRDTTCKGDRRITTTWLPNNWLDTRTIATATDACAAERSGDPAAWQSSQVESRTYLDNGLPASMTTRNGEGEVKESHEVGYEQDGAFLGLRTRDVFRRVGPSGATPCQTTTCTETWAYDARGKLTRHDDGHGGVTDYTLDGPAAQRDPAVRGGNVTHEAGPAATVDRTYVGDRLETTTRAGVTSRSWYDSLGRLDCVTTAAGSQNDCTPTSPNLITDYTYDYLDRLEAARTYQSKDLTDESTYQYDALDRTTIQTEMHKRTGTLTRRTEFTYIGSGAQPAAETVTTSGDTGGAASPDSRDEKSYSYDAYGQRFHLTDQPSVKQPDGSFQDQAQSSVTYGYDPHSSVSLLLNDSGADRGTARAVYGYTPYGGSDDQLSQGDEDKLAPLNPYRYTGKRFDSGSQTLDMGVRRFDPASSRFLQQDLFRSALGDLGLTLDPLSQNRYALAGGNPTSFIETDGHVALADVGGGGSAASASASSASGSGTGADQPPPLPKECEDWIYWEHCLPWQSVTRNPDIPGPPGPGHDVTVQKADNLAPGFRIEAVPIGGPTPAYRCMYGNQVVDCNGYAQYTDLVVKYANEAGVDPRQLMTTMLVESEGLPHGGWEAAANKVTSMLSGFPLIGRFFPEEGRPRTLGVGNMSEETFNQAKAASGGKITGTWGESAGNPELSIQALAWKLRQLNGEGGQLKGDNALLRRDEVTAAKYNGETELNAKSEEYIHKFNNYWPQADQWICRSGVYTCG